MIGIPGGFRLCVVLVGVLMVSGATAGEPTFYVSPAAPSQRKKPGPGHPLEMFGSNASAIRSWI